MGKPLSEKERNFVIAFLGPARGNATDAAKIAGYGNNRKTQATLGWKLLRKMEIQQAVVRRTERKEAKAILSADERDEMLSTIARRLASSADTAGAIRAIAELNKVSGRHSVRHVLEGKLTLEQALDASRK